MRKKLAAALCMSLILTALSPAALMAEENAAEMEIPAELETAPETETEDMIQTVTGDGIEVNTEDSAQDAAEQIVIPEGADGEVTIIPAETEEVAAVQEAARSGEDAEVSSVEEDTVEAEPAGEDVKAAEQEDTEAVNEAADQAENGGETAETEDAADKKAEEADAKAEKADDKDAVKTEDTEEEEEEVVEAEEEEELEQASQPTVTYRTHVQSIGWQGWKKNGAMSGTQGRAKRLEGIEIKVQGVSGLGIRYKTHVQKYGWQGWKSNGAMSGTKGEAKRLEAIQIELTGKNASKYDVYYCVHAQHYGWLNWAKNGAQSGTAGYAYRLEGIKIRIVPKGSKAPAKEGTQNAAFISKADGPGMNITTQGVAYNTHVQSYGWQDYVVNGGMSGTSGKAKRLEGIHIALIGQKYSGNIEYRTHVQSYGWQTWKKNGAMSGTSGEAKRLEAIDIKLTGEMAKHYDVYYRVHAQSFGWLNWAKNGQSAGTAGFAKRLEGIQIVLVEKGKAAPGNLKGIKSTNDKPFYDKVNVNLFETDGAYAGIEADMKLTGSGSGYHAKIDIHDKYGVAVSFGIQYEYNLSRQYPNIANNTAFLVENVMSHATQAGHQGKNYHFLQSANLGQNYKVAFSWFQDNSLRFYVDGQEIFRTSTTLTPPLFFQVEGSAMRNGDTINAQFSNVRVKCGTSPHYGIWAEWNDRDFDFFGLQAQVTKAGKNVDNGQWSTNGWATSGISATVTGTATIGGGADWDTCFSQVEPSTGKTGYPLSGIVMIASREAAYSA